MINYCWYILHSITTPIALLLSHIPRHITSSAIHHITPHHNATYHLTRYCLSSPTTAPSRLVSHHLQLMFDLTSLLLFHLPSSSSLLFHFRHYCLTFSHLTFAKCLCSIPIDPLAPLHGKKVRLMVGLMKGWIDGGEWDGWMDGWGQIDRGRWESVVREGERVVW